LHDNFKIDLKHQISIVQGDDMLYKPIVNNFYMRTKGFKDLDLRNEDPFCKVLVINETNNGDPDSDYERERSYYSDEDPDADWTGH
jgi:hypothetical protein